MPTWVSICSAPGRVAPDPGRAPAEDTGRPKVVVTQCWETSSSGYATPQSEAASATGSRYGTVLRLPRSRPGNSIVARNGNYP